MDQAGAGWSLDENLVRFADSEDPRSRSYGRPRSSSRWPHGHSAPGSVCGTGPDPNIPSVGQPPANATLTTESVYVQVVVLENEAFEVWLREGLVDPAADVTAQFTFSHDLTGNTKEVHHANIPVGLNDTHEVWVVQYKAAEPSSSWTSAKRQFTQASGAVVELGPLSGGLGGTVGQVVSQPITGAVERPASRPRVALWRNRTQRRPHPLGHRGNHHGSGSQ